MKESFRKIGVLRANALGDFILTLPALQALKSTWPGSEVVLIGRELHKNFYGNRPGPLDRIISIPSSFQFNEAMWEMNNDKRTFIEDLRSEQFDLIVQLHGGGKYSNAFVKFLSPKLSVGAMTPGSPVLDVWIPYNRFQHEVFRQLEIVSLVGAKTHTFAPSISVTEDDRHLGQRFLKNLRAGQRPMVLINPGATDPRRRWPPHKFAEVCNVVNERGFDVLINIGPFEQELGRKIFDPIKSKRNVWIIRPALAELIGVVSLMDLVISNDTGVLHLAMAVGRPTVGLFWFGNLLNYGPLLAGKNRVLISRQTHCPLCDGDYYKEECSHEYSIVSDISVSDVLGTALDLLNVPTEEKGVAYG